jgi:hypothetical protein
LQSTIRRQKAEENHSAAWAAALFVRMTLRAALAFSIAGSGYLRLTSGLNDLVCFISEASPPRSFPGD